MRSLLDINVLIALVDEDHVFHDRAHRWYRRHKKPGWASCPLTENGIVRIMSNPGYHRKREHSPAEIVAAVKNFAANSDHRFWPDDISLRDKKWFDPRRILGSRQLTDIYLLGLAAKNNGRLITFDEAINPIAVPGATSANLRVITDSLKT